MKIIHLNNVLCFDCETTGVPEKGMKWDEDFLRFPRPVTPTTNVTNELLNVTDF